MLGPVWQPHTSQRREDQCSKSWSVSRESLQVAQNGLELTVILLLRIINMLRPWVCATTPAGRGSCNHWALTPAAIGKSVALSWDNSKTWSVGRCEVATLMGSTGTSYRQDRQLLQLKIFWATVFSSCHSHFLKLGNFSNKGKCAISISLLLMVSCFKENIGELFSLFPVALKGRSPH